MKNRNIIYVIILFWFVCLGLPQSVQAAVPAPDDGYADGNTAEGHVGLLSLFLGSDNTAIGLFSLSRNAADFNTALCAGALLANTSAENTTTDGGVLSSNIIVSLLILPWVLRALASAKAIWQALTDGQKSERKQERCALAES